MVLANTYHLLLRPGVEVIERLGGLHRFMAWPGPILTDSGGLPGLLARRRGAAIDDDGVAFRSHIDGAELRLTPEGCVDAQRRLGVDVAMALDVCPALPAAAAELEAAVATTSRWAARCRAALPPGGDTLLFGIVQGGLDFDLRRRSAEELGRDRLRRLRARRVLGRRAAGGDVGGGGRRRPRCCPARPAALPDGRRHARRPRRRGGGGRRPVRLRDADPQRPQRAAAHLARARSCSRTPAGSAADEPPDPACDCPTCRRCSLAYLRHLYLAREAAVVVLATVHNLHFFLSLMRRVRWAIMTGRFAAAPRRGCSRRRPRAAEDEETAMDAQRTRSFQFLPFLLIFGIFYLLLIMPMRKRQKKHQELLGKLTKGDRVITTGGIFGTVVEVEDDVLTLRIADNVKIQVARSAVAGLAKDAGTVDLTRQRAQVGRCRCNASSCGVGRSSRWSRRPPCSSCCHSTRGSTSASTSRAASTWCCRSTPRTRSAPRSTTRWSGCAAT